VPKDLRRKLQINSIQPESASREKELSFSRINITKEQADLIIALSSILLRISSAIGGLILVVYAAKERFFYDVSSLAAIGAVNIPRQSRGL
jgi:hypothetical protein